MEKSEIKKALPLSLAPVIISVTFMAFYWALYSEVTRADEAGQDFDFCQLTYQNDDGS